jgi:hypothetical protein
MMWNLHRFPGIMLSAVLPTRTEIASQYTLSPKIPNPIESFQAPTLVNIFELAGKFYFHRRNWLTP